MVLALLEKGSHVLSWELGEKFGQRAPSPGSCLGHGKREPHPRQKPSWLRKLLPSLPPGFHVSTDVSLSTAWPEDLPISAPSASRRLRPDPGPLRHEGCRVIKICKHGSSLTTVCPSKVKAGAPVSWGRLTVQSCSR